MEDGVISGFKRDFLVVKEKGWIPSNRFHDTGIGKTFEDLIGIVENNNSLADYQGILELKSSRELSENMVTLFTKSPFFPKRANAILRERYGKPDEEVEGMKTLRTTASALKFNSFVDKSGFKLEIDEINKKIFVRIKDLQTSKIEDIEIYYTFEQLQNVVENKCKYIVYITAESEKEDGKEFFKFTKAVLWSGLTFDKFIDAIKKGFIAYDIRLGVYKSGKNKGKTHDHGSGFRIFKDKVSRVFEVKEL